MIDTVMIVRISNVFVGACEIVDSKGAWERGKLSPIEAPGSLHHWRQIFTQHALAVYVLQNMQTLANVTFYSSLAAVVKSVCHQQFPTAIVSPAVASSVCRQQLSTVSVINSCQQYLSSAVVTSVYSCHQQLLTESVNGNYEQYLPPAVANSQCLPPAVATGVCHQQLPPVLAINSVHVSN